MSVPHSMVVIVVNDTIIVKSLFITFFLSGYIIVELLRNFFGYMD